MQSVAAQRPYFFDQVRRSPNSAWTNSRADRTPVRRVAGYTTRRRRLPDLRQGSMVVQAEAVADYLRENAQD